MRKWGLSSVVVLSVLLLSAVVAGAQMRSPFPAAESTNKVAVELYSKFSGKQGNVFFSPYSISSALAMVQLGARGDTLEQLNRALHFDANTPKDMSQLRETLGKASNQSGALYTANSIWPQKNYPFLPHYTQSLKTYFDVKVKPQDFASNPEASRVAINNWVAEQTRDRIRDILQPGSIEKNTRMVLANAVYFKAAWAKPFEEENTRNDFFYLNANKAHIVKMMNQNDRFDYMQNDELAIVRLPYKERHQSMVIVLPKQRNGLAQLEKNLKWSSLKEWMSHLQSQPVNLFMPRFELEETLDLKSSLTDLGVRDLFTAGKADLSGMDGTKKLYMGLAVHKAFISVNEKETEAAASTVMAIVAMSAPMEPVEMRINHPFLFLIQDEKTGTILFMGRVANFNK